MKTLRILLLAGSACFLSVGLARANFTMTLVINSNYNPSSYQVTIRDYNGTAVSGATSVYPSGSPVSHSSPTYTTTSYNISLPDSLLGQAVSVGNTANTGAHYSAMFSAQASVQLPYEAFSYSAVQTGAALTGLTPTVGDITVRNPLGDTSSGLMLELDTYSGTTTTVSSSDNFGLSFSKVSSLPTLNQQFIGTTGQWRWSVQTSATPPAEKPVMILDDTGNLTLNYNSTAGITLNGQNGITLASGRTLDMGTGTISNVGSLGVGSLAATSISVGGHNVLTTDSVLGNYLGFDSSHNFAGPSCLATTAYSVAEGFAAYASANGAIALGSAAWANSMGSTALGGYTYTTGQFSLATGWYSSAYGAAQTVLGRYNIHHGTATYNTFTPSYFTSNSSDRYLFVIGNGTSTDPDNYTVEPTLSDAFLVSETGDTWMSGRVRVAGGTATAPSTFTGNVEFDGPVVITATTGDLSMGEFTATP